jgi:hypothetical protein
MNKAGYSLVIVKCVRTKLHWGLNILLDIVKVFYSLDLHPLREAGNHLLRIQTYFYSL